MFWLMSKDSLRDTLVSKDTQNAHKGNNFMLEPRRSRPSKWHDMWRICLDCVDVSLRAASSSRAARRVAWLKANEEQTICKAVTTVKKRERNRAAMQLLGSNFTIRLLDVT
jgi:hypothetical protein